MKKWTIDVFSEKEIQSLSTDFPKGNDYICETAGFVPLEVKFKQFEQNGIVAQLKTSDFTSHDYREMYLNPDFDISPDDDLEDIEEKRILLMQHISDIKKKVAARAKKESDGTAPSQKEKPEKEADKAADKDE